MTTRKQTAPEPGSPLPWKQCGGYTPRYMAIHSSQGYIVFGLADEELIENGASITCPDTETQRKNSAYIVHACNNYPKLVAVNRTLVEALEGLLVEPPSNTIEYWEWQRAHANRFSKARTALAQAKEVLP